MTDLMYQTLETVRFDELSRIRELIAHTRARREMSVTSNGHVLAMMAAASGISPGAALSHQWGGLLGLQHLKSLDKSLEDKTRLAKFARDLGDLHDYLTSGEREFLLVGETEKNSQYQTEIERLFASDSAASRKPFSLNLTEHRQNQLWQTSTQVNFCARAYPTVSMAHPDAAALNVLGGFLRNGYLHRVIREQGGAYGGGASQDNTHGAFRFYSYRDPRVEGTLDDFDKALDWLKSGKHAFEQVEEAILGVISSIDKPGSPAGEAKQTFHAELYGKTREIRETFRNRVVQVTVDDLVRVADKYLTPENARSAVLTNPDMVAKLQHLEFETFSL